MVRSARNHRPHVAGVHLESGTLAGGLARLARRAGKPAFRRGLSPLELVLALPLLLLIMALMINFGTAASWKVRTLLVARHAAWSARWPRTPDQFPRPDYWPESAAAAEEDAGRLEALDDPRVDLPVARGPLPMTRVHDELLDPTRGLRVATARLSREFPLLGKLGAYQLQSRQWILDDKWQYQRMGLPANRHRRIPVIYELAKADPSHMNRYAQAINALVSSPCWPLLAPLDRDPQVGFRDFHPRLRRFCTVDTAVAGEQVNDLIDHIQGNGRRHVPSVFEVMVSAYTRAGW